MWMVHVEGVWVNKDFLVFHLQKETLLITEGPAPRDGLWPCSPVPSSLQAHHPELAHGGFSVSSEGALRTKWRIFAAEFGPFLSAPPFPPPSCGVLSLPIHLFLKRLCHCVHQYVHGLSCFSLGLKVQSKSVYGFGELILPHPRFLNRLFLYQACRACRMY